jgi:hypothetical protein
LGAAQQGWGPHRRRRVVQLYLAFVLGLSSASSRPLATGSQTAVRPYDCTGSTCPWTAEILLRSDEVDPHQESTLFGRVVTTAAFALRPFLYAQNRLLVFGKRALSTSAAPAPHSPICRRWGTGVECRADEAAHGYSSFSSISRSAARLGAAADADTHRVVVRAEMTPRSHDHPTCRCARLGALKHAGNKRPLQARQKGTGPTCSLRSGAGRPSRFTCPVMEQEVFGTQGTTLPLTHYLWREQAALGTSTSSSTSTWQRRRHRRRCCTCTQPQPPPLIESSHNRK